MEKNSAVVEGDYGGGNRHVQRDYTVLGLLHSLFGGFGTNLVFISDAGTNTKQFCFHTEWVETFFYS